MTKHLDRETLRRLAQRELTPVEIAHALRHLGECPECAGHASVDLTGDIARVQAVLAEDAGLPARHLTFDELAAWVTGTREDDLERHLAWCASCRSDAADLAHLRAVMKPRRHWIRYAVAAAIVIAVVIALVVFRRPPPTQPPPVVRETAPPTTTQAPEREERQAPIYARAEWERLVASALLSGRLSYPPDLALLRGGTETVRGEGEGESVTLAPSGVVIDETQPQLSWPATPRAKYIVSIFDGDRQVAQSEPLAARRWTPPRALPRGRTYTWQVEVLSDSATTVLPAPPAPPARFRIVNADDHETLVAAREQHPNDHLLLGVLYAKAGMEAEAKAELRQLAGAANAPLKRLLAHELAGK